MSVVLDLGCGTRPRPGAVGVDGNQAAEPDVLHDLNVRPYPFPDDHADEVYLDNVLEHLDDVIGTLEEVHRICRQNAMVRIDVPYFRSHWAAVDPTHKHMFAVDSMGYVCVGHIFHDRYRYSAARFRLEKVVFNERFPTKGVRWAVTRLANRFPHRYEASLSPLYPLDELTYVLRVDKG